MNDELLIVLIIAAIIGIVVAIFYLINLQNLLKEIAPGNRTVEPGNVWLMLIPLFSLIYGFILYPKVSESLKNEMEARELNEQSDYGRMLGLSMPILSLVGFIPVVGNLAGIANLVIMIVYWVKMANYKDKLQRSPAVAGIIGSSGDLLDN